MVESNKEYVLQWTGHAAHVTERFSGLLARQALVDVTLICQGQKLRVHKLVLASCSLYFEEMLEQDLGQEPIILLRDLDFEVLKAMVEFMYCGETTISHCHLQILLDAAQVFKVKELECIVKSMLETERKSGNELRKKEDSEGVISSTSDRKKNIIKARPSGERCHERSPSSDINEDLMSESKNDQTVDNNMRINYRENDDENSLYETVDMVNEISAIGPKDERGSSDSSSVVTLDSSDGEASKMCTSEDDEEALMLNKISNPTDENVLKSILVERCCNYLDDTVTRESSISHNENVSNKYDSQDITVTVGECSKVYSHKKRKYAKTDDYSDENLSDSASSRVEDESLTDYSADCSDTGSSKIDNKCLKVYTHKRRKSVDEKKFSNVDRIVDSLKEPTSSTCCIDLSDETSTNNPPVTLPSALDMETSEYIWSLSTESIQYVVGCTINQSSQLSNSKEITSFRDNADIDTELDSVVVTSNDKTTRQMKELFSVDNGNLDIATRPVLRRSVRINQLETDDSINNNGAITLTTSTQKSRDKIVVSRRDDFGANGINVTSTKAKRRVNKDTDYGGISDENNVVTTSQSALRKNTNNSRSLRSAKSRLENEKSSVKSRCAFSRNDRYEQKTKTNVKSRSEKMEKAESTDCDISLPPKLNTIASVDRALWGDMSDVLENCENGVTLITDYSPSKEIPFAVGLLPLRAALERMQATLDHQPRKTRSSVAPQRQEHNGFRRKIPTNNVDAVSTAKKQNNNIDSDTVDRPNTVCHIEIRTSEECSENRRNSNNQEIVAVGSTSENNRR